MHKLLHPQQLCLNHCLLWTFILLHDVKKKKVEKRLDVIEKSKEQKRSKY